jgi:hypothetical protein
LVSLRLQHPQQGLTVVPQALLHYYLTHAVFAFQKKAMILVSWEFV